MSAPNPAQMAVAQLNGQPKDPTVTPHTCGTAVCPVHRTNHKPDGGWIEVHNPGHPRHTPLFRGRRCVTVIELEADYAGVTVEELRRRIRSEWTIGADKKAFLKRLRDEPRSPAPNATPAPSSWTPPSPLSVPWPGDDLRGAALAYARAGWFVLPVRYVKGKGHKHAGSLLGKGWPDKTSRDPEVIERWFDDERDADVGLALHVGRSGAVVFDVDHPEHLHPKLVKAFEHNRPLFQSTSKVDPRRGHYLYRVPEGTVFGNSVGDLKTTPAWGEVRGTNGIIVVQPTPRDDPSKRYRWVRYGHVPFMFAELGRALLGLDRPKVKTRWSRNHIARPASKGRLDGLVNAVLGAEDGRQQQLLFWAACRFGEMVADGVIDEELARELLIDVGLQLHNYRPDDPWTEASVTLQVDSGLRTGKWACS